MKRRNLIWVTVILLNLLLYNHESIAYKIVGYGHDTYSHTENVIKIGKEINRRGHHFVLFVSSDISKMVNLSNIDIVTYPATTTPEQQIKCLAATIKNRWNFSMDCMELANRGCDGMIKDRQALERIRKDTDMLFVDITSFCGILVDKILNISSVIMYSSAGFLDPTLSRKFKIPAPPAYVPTVLVDYSNKMTFFQRLHNTLTYVAIVALRYFFESKQHERYRRLVDETLSGYDVMNANMIIISSDFALDYPRPITPATKVIGPLQPHPPSKLSQEFAKFTQLSWNESNNFILVSFGSLVSDKMKDIIDFQAIGRALSRLPFKVIWKYNGHIDNLGDNVKLYSWLPQNDLLGQENCKIFVTHCGLNSMYEGAYHGVPMVAVPFFADQPSNAQRIKSAGIGTVVLFSQLNEHSLHEAILRTYQSKTIRESSRKVASIMTYRPGNRTPVEEAVDWIEYAIRHKGGEHLKIPVHPINWYEEYMLDVTVVLIVMLLILYQIMRIIFRFTCNGLRGLYDLTRT